MSKDALKFHRQTRPLKFRRLKKFHQSVGHSYGVGVDKVRYLINYILYKLNILKRYTNSVTDEIWNPVIRDEVSPTYTEEVRTDNFVGTVKTCLKDYFEHSTDYFYYTDRRGLRHTTYVVYDHISHKYTVSSGIINPGLIIDKNIYRYQNSPKIVRTFKRPEIKPALFSEDTLIGNTHIPPETIDYDMTKLLNIRYETVLGHDPDLDVTYATLQCARLEAVTEIKRYLSRLSLRDIEV